VDCAGSGSASVNENASVMIDVRCKYRLTMQLPSDDAGYNSSNSILIDSIVFTPDYKHSRAYSDAGKLN